MASLESLIFQALTDDGTLSPLLARFNNVPAVFELLAPADDAPGWVEQSPRIEFFVEREEDPERRVSGQLSISIVHKDTSTLEAAAIDAEVRRLLDGATFRPDEGTVTLRWNNAQPFEEERAYFRGVELIFDLIAWPSGLTYSPDPVQALRDWSETKWVELQADPETWTPSDATPAIYWRLSQIDEVEMMPWGSWISGRFQGHLLAQTPGVRLSWVRKICEGGAVDRDIQMSDGSRLLFETVAATGDADLLRDGQITFTARFGVLIQRNDPILTNANVSGAVEGEV